MNENSGDEGAKLIIILVLIAVVAWVVLNVVLLLGVLAVVGLTAGSVYYGFKLGYKIANVDPKRNCEGLTSSALN